MTHRSNAAPELTQSTKAPQRNRLGSNLEKGMKWQALCGACSLALLAASTSAAAQISSTVLATGTTSTQVARTSGTASAPALVCQRATITVFPTCPMGTSHCGPGDGPGMSQLLGIPGTSTGVTGTAIARGTVLAASKTVDFSYRVPDVRFFAPTVYAISANQLTPVTTQTWIIKASEVPGVSGSNALQTHAAGDFSTGFTGTTTTAGQTSATGNWLLLGKVSAQAVVAGYFKDVSYGFSCDLPVQNMNLVNPFYQPPITFKP